MPHATPASRPTCVVTQTHLTDLPPFNEIFDPVRPIEVDIGCGKGRFLLAHAAANRHLQFLGIERLLARVRSMDRKLQRMGLDNVHLIRLEAGYTLQRFIPAHAVSRFYLLFPDPWPKRRHHKRRLFDAAFRSLIWSRLIPEGEIQIATDHLDYFADIQRQLANDPRFDPVPAVERLPEEQTNFEQLFRTKGYPIGACGFRARPAAAIDPERLARVEAEEQAEAEAATRNRSDDTDDADDADGEEEEASTLDL